ncbi:MAG: MFS transporter [Ilumatobacteraceae bacterium]
MPRTPAPLLLVTGLVLALLAMGYGALFSVLDDIRDDYGIGETALGAIIGIGFFAGFLAQVLIAPFADRGHARRLVLAGLLLDVAGLVLIAASRDVPGLLLGRFVMGVGVGTAVPAVRRIMIVAEPDRIGHNLGRLLAADVGGFAAGPAVAAVLVGPLGIPGPFLVIAAAVLISVPIIARVARIPETEAPPAARLAFDLLRIRPFAGAVALGCGVFLMIGCFDALWTVALDDLDTAEWVANLGITMFALPLVVFGSIGGRLAQRVGPFRVGSVGLLLGSGFMLLYGLVPTGLMMFAVAMVHSVSDALTVSSAGVAVGLVVPAARQAGAQGVLGGLETLCAGVSALVVGALYEHAGRAAAYGTAAAAMFLLVVVGVLLARGSWRLRGAPPTGATDRPAPVAG